MPSADKLPLTMIVPVHDRPEKLDRALRSVARQSRLPAKVIVVDDGSAAPVAADADLRSMLDMELIRHDVNRGAAAARNTGLRAATTEWVSFLDSDDYLLGESLALRWRLLRERLEAGAANTKVFGCGWIDFGEAGGALGIRLPRPSTSAADFASGCWFSPGSCVIVNRQAVLAAGDLQDESLHRFEDLDWFLSLALRGFTLEVLPVVAVAIERARVQKPERAGAAAELVLAKWRGRLPKSLLRRLESYLALEVAAAYHYHGSRLRSLAQLGVSMAKVPRRSLQLSPGWEMERLANIPENSFVT